MKVTYQMEFAEQDSPMYVVRGAILLRALADALEKEAQGGTVVSRVGAGVQTSHGDSIICKEIENE